MNRIDVIRAAAEATGAERYLEIGVKDGACFHAIDVQTRVAVDPRFRFGRPIASRVRTALHARTGSLYFPTTSDRFFERHARRLAPFDVVFVDGLHTYDQAYRDVANALDVLGEGGIVVVHDCNPTSAAAAAPSLELAARTDGWAGEWSGDVYRAIVRLRAREDLRTSVLDCDQGVAIVVRGAPEDRLRLTPTEIDGLDYGDLARDRERLLGLRPPGDLALLLGGVEDPA